MKHCPITYEIIDENQTYSIKGLKSLSPQLTHLEPLEYSADEQRQEAISRVGKMSIQGAQIKLSAQLKIKEGRFEIVDQKGQYILKPQNEYPQLPENEALTMTLAKTIGIEVPIHGLIYSKDKSFTYFIKRFDREKKQQKIAVEDFGQLSGFPRERKYKSSTENVINIINSYCSSPKIEMAKLYRLILFNFLVGNEDMHLKNFSLITRDQNVTLSPAYDLLNTTIAGHDKEELALPMNGKKRNLNRNDFFVYLAVERLGLNKQVIDRITQEFKVNLPLWKQLIAKSFLSAEMQRKYLRLLEERCDRLGL